MIAKPISISANGSAITDSLLVRSPTFQQVQASILSLANIKESRPRNRFADTGALGLSSYGRRPARRKSLKSPILPKPPQPSADSRPDGERVNTKDISVSAIWRSCYGPVNNSGKTAGCELMDKGKTR